MLLCMKVNITVTEIALVHRNVKYAATHPYKLKSVSKIHRSKPKNFMTGDVR